jgi:uncharacterized repeat protein (TIGR01451 family)
MARIPAVARRVLASLTVVVAVVCGFGLVLHAGTYTVTNTASSGPGSLRQAILDANSGTCPSPCTIQFNIPGPAGPGGVHVIQPNSKLPWITASNVTIDGGTQTTFGGDTNPAGPEIVLDGSLTGMLTEGIVSDGNFNVIRGLVVNRFAEITGSGFAIVINGDNNVVAGNYVGTDAAGASASPNYAGITVFGANNTIGGASAADRNVVSGNRTHGVHLNGAGATGNVVKGNYLGTNAAGTAAIPNFTSGVQIAGGAWGNTIGGSGGGNVISGNTQVGVIVWNAGAANQIAANLIGVGALGGALPNGSGIEVSDSTAGVMIGGTSAGDGNQISFNSGAGLYVVPTSRGAAIRRNSIAGNGAIGIDLATAIGPPVVTANDAGDADAGANNLQNFPVLTSATSTPGGGTIAGTLNSTPLTSFDIEFFHSPGCDPSGFGEGQIYLATAAVSTDAAGNASFTVPIFGTLGAGAITATATDPSGNTSEFAACVSVTVPSVSADLQITKVAAPAASVLVRSKVTYTMALTNHGPSLATNVTITDTPSAGQTFVATSLLSCAGGGAAGTCNLGSLASGATMTFTLEMSPDALGTVSNTISVTADQTDPVPSNNSATASVPVVKPPAFSGSGSATIDGVLGATEWGGAACQSIYVWIPNATGAPNAVTPATLCVMNDLTNLYISLKFAQSAVEPGNSLGVEFDLDNDGVMEEGDDVFVVNPELSPAFVDDFRTLTVGGCSGGICGFRDVDHGGSNDGQAVFANDGSVSVYEVSKPLNSGDSRDMAKCAGDTVGFFMSLRMIGAGASWPAGFADTDYPGWGQYVSINLVGECASQAVAAAAAVSTDSEGDGATAADPVETTVLTPVPGTISISEGPAGPSTSGFMVLGQQVQITAPTATAADPLIITFVIDQSLLPPGVTASSIEVRRNGVVVPDCIAAGATPDPCVQSKMFLASGDLEIVVRTSQASLWDFGVTAGPSNADACRNGGWAILGFANQGHCVRFVKTGKDKR